MPPACTAPVEEGEQAQDRGLGHMPPWTHPPGPNRLVRCHLQEAFPDSTPQALPARNQRPRMTFPLWTVGPFRVELPRFTSIQHISHEKSSGLQSSAGNLHPPEDTHVQVPVAPQPSPNRPGSSLWGPAHTRVTVV